MDDLPRWTLESSRVPEEDVKMAWEGLDVLVSWNWRVLMEDVMAQEDRRMLDILLRTQDSEFSR